MSWKACLAVTALASGTSKPFFPGALNRFPPGGVSDLFVCRPVEVLSCPLDCKHREGRGGLGSVPLYPLVPTARGTEPGPEQELVW